MRAAAVPKSSLSYLLFVAGATRCALSCQDVHRVTSVDEGEDLPLVDVDGLGLGKELAEAAASARRCMLWVRDGSADARLPIVGAPTVAEFTLDQILPLPEFYLRLTPFCALLHSEAHTALLLAPSALARLSLEPHPPSLRP